MVATNVRTDLALKGGLQLKEAAGFPPQAGAGVTCFQDGVLYVRGMASGVKAWFPLNAPQGHYVHKQGASARVWTVRHGFGDAVAVMAYSSQGEALPAAVTYADGVATVDVGSARTGYAVAFGVAFASVAQGAKADSAVQPDSLAKVATSGKYGDLSGRPSLGSAASKSATDFAGSGHKHDDTYVSLSEFADALTQLAEAFEEGAGEIGAVVIHNYSQHLEGGELV
ncbi:hypothetical protein ACT3R7_12130 [Halomonas sp. AOP43-A1-21]